VFITSGTNAPEIEVQLPALAGASITLDVTVKRPDGGVSSGTYTFSTITPIAAGLEHLICELNQVLTKAPFQTKPGDPEPDGGRILNPGDIATLAGAVQQLARASAAAASAGGPITLAQLPRAVVASNVTGGTARPTIAGAAEPALAK
jgi:hypothetical protein